MDETKKLIDFLNECLKDHPEIADWNTIYDSQTQLIVDYLYSEESFFKILDYGCGKLRALNVLIKNFESTKWEYVGYDPFLPDLKTISLPPSSEYNWKIKVREEILKDNTQFDFILVQNVLHEIGIYQAANLLQDCIKLLKSSGKLLVLDTPLLPKGEPEFVPIFDWEIPILFKNSVQLSGKSPKGLPLLFHVIPKNGIPYYSAVLRIFPKILEGKRNILADFAFYLSKNSEKITLDLIHLGIDKIFDYVYINIIIGNITRRLGTIDIEISDEGIDNCGAEIVEYIERELRVPIVEIYKFFSPKYTYEIIFYVIQLMINHHMFIFGNDTHNGAQELVLSEIYDILVDQVGGSETILKMGLEKSLVQARIKFGEVYPDNAFGL